VDPLRTAVIMKTDIGASTPRFRALLESDLSALLAEHREFVARIAARHGGSIAKPEGDAFWLVFPSVTAAAQAAMTMQEELRLAQPGKGDDRLAIRVVITLGDVLLGEGSLVGDAVVLAARIETITPLDEIYLSAAAWLAVHRAEVRTAFVEAFVLKGFAEPVPVYRVDQRHRTRVIEDQYIVIADLRGFAAFSESHAMADVERVLDWLLELAGRTCREFGGVNRFQAGDSCFLTFGEASGAMRAVEQMAEASRRFQREHGFPCSLNVAVHKGTLYAFRSYLHGRDVNVAAGVEGATHRLSPSAACDVFVTGPVRADLAGTPWDARLTRIDLPEMPPRLEGVHIYRLA
jgi:class 3 adenylate cyclase